MAEICEKSEQLMGYFFMAVSSTSFAEKHTASKGQRRRIYSEEICTSELLSDGIEDNPNDHAVSEASRLRSEIKNKLTILTISVLRKR
jgi:hypothetical protein